MKKELKNLTEKQEEECRDIIMYWDLDEFDKSKIKTFIAKIRKESIKYERERIKKEFIKGMKEIAIKEL